MRCLVFGLGFLLSLWCGHASAEQPEIGYVKLVVGSATIIRDGARLPAQLAMAVHENDEIETGADGQVGVTFLDNTRISMGAQTRLNLGRFLFRPAEQQYGLVLRLLTGTMHYISGLTAKLAPDTVSITTPKFAVAVRGTRLLIRAED